MFSNATLEELITLKPSNREELLNVKGIAELKAEWFGEQIVDIMKNHLSLRN